MPRLTVNGQINLLSDVRSTGDQVYNGAVVVPSFNNSTTIESLTGDVTFNSTLNSTSSFYSDTSTINILANQGSVTFNDSVGRSYKDSAGNIVPVSSIFDNNNIDRLAVSANDVFVNADIITLDTQTYSNETQSTNVWIGDNGSNGLDRIMLTQDPRVTIQGSINDRDPNKTHSLSIIAISLNRNDIAPEIDIGNVGQINPLKTFSAITGTQTNPSALLGLVDSSFNGSLKTGDVTTLLGQTYRASDWSISGNKYTSISGGDGAIEFQYDTTNNNTTQFFRENPPIVIYENIPIPNQNTSSIATTLAGSLSNSILQNLKYQEMKKLNEGNAGEGVVEVGEICGQKTDIANVSKECKK
jgi:hypothetical protein